MRRKATIEELERHAAYNHVCDVHSRAINLLSEIIEAQGFKDAVSFWNGVLTHFINNVNKDPTKYDHYVNDDDDDDDIDEDKKEDKDND